MRGKAIKKAIEQLEASVLGLENVDFNGRKLFAILGFSSPKSRIINSGSGSKKADFKEKYGIKLMEGHAIPLED
jgi:hypothetical protein